MSATFISAETIQRYALQLCMATGERYIECLRAAAAHVINHKTLPETEHSFISQLVRDYGEYHTRMTHAGIEIRRFSERFELLSSREGQGRCMGRGLRVGLLVRLRNEAGCSLAEARNALEQREWNLEFAREYLRKRNLAVAHKDESNRYPRWKEYLDSKTP